MMVMTMLSVVNINTSTISNLIIISQLALQFYYIFTGCITISIQNQNQTSETTQTTSNNKYFNLKEAQKRSRREYYKRGNTYECDIVPTVYVGTQCKEK